MPTRAPTPGPGRRTARDHGVELVTRLPLFLSSYLPLFVILTVRFDQPAWLWWTCLGLVVGGVFSAVAVLRAVRKGPTTTLEVEEVRDAGAEAGGYLASYVLPFVTVSAPSGRDVVGYGIFLVVLVLIYVRSDLLQVNPAVYVLLRRLVRVRSTAGEEVYIIVRDRPRKGMQLSVRTFAGIHVATKEVVAGG